MSTEPTILLQGRLDLLVLQSLAAGEMHGLGMRRIQQVIRGTFVVKPGWFFLALRRMEEESRTWSFWSDLENHRRAKYYRLTRARRKQLAAESKRWERISWAIRQATETS